MFSLSPVKLRSGIALGILGSLLVFPLLDGTEHDCQTEIIGTQQTGYSVTCTYHIPCPGDTDCKKKVSTVEETTVTTCACMDGSTTDCCAAYHLEIEGRTGFALAGDCYDQDPNCEPGTCQEVAQDVPAGKPPKFQANCMIEI